MEEDLIARLWQKGQEVMEEYGRKKCQRKCQAAGLCQCLARAVWSYTGRYFRAKLPCAMTHWGACSALKMGLTSFCKNMSESSRSLAMHFWFQQYFIKKYIYSKNLTKKKCYDSNVAKSWLEHRSTWLHQTSGKNKDKNTNKEITYEKLKTVWQQIVRSCWITSLMVRTWLRKYIFRTFK